jgi:phytoene dehydrogenase-like protein
MTPVEHLADGDNGQRPSGLSRDRYDVIVVGAGMAGLAVGALLAKDGRKVAILEAIHYPGGCASSYEDGGAWFDVGATTVCGTDAGQPLRMLFDEVGWFDGLLACQPTLSAVIGGRRLDLTSDRRLWYDRMNAFFSVDQRRFWDEVFSVSDGIYGSVGRLPYLPPISVREWMADAKGLNRDLLRSFPWMFSTVASRLRHHGIDGGDLRRFVDAQLLITNQLNAGEARMLSGSLGLSYANGTVSSVRGGVLNLARFLEERAVLFGAEFGYRHRVVSIRQEGTGWCVRTRRGVVLRAGEVITTLPLFNLPEITEGPVAAHYQRLIERVRAAGVQLWSAVTLTAVIPDMLPRPFPVNLQVLPDAPIASVGADSMFLSFSHEFDGSRSPAGTRTLSVSMHIRPERFAELSDAASYDAWKARVGPEVLAAIRASVPELQDLTPLRSEVGTPRTFRRYTNRVDGLVGGIPLHRSIFPWSYPRPVTPFEGLSSIGDTFFPGQGIPGVVMGALALWRRWQEDGR